MIIIKSILITLLFIFASHLFSVLMLFTTNRTLANEAYQWIDGNNVMHFSDTPPTTGKHHQTKTNKISLPNIPTTSAKGQLNKANLASLESSQHTPTLHNFRVKISNLSNHQTIRNNLGLITIQAKLTQPLNDTQQLQLILDNQAHGKPQKGLFWQLENIDRGSHYFSINIIKSGKIIASSDTITVYLHRARTK